MQKVTFNTEELKKRLSVLGNVVAKKTTLPVLGFLRLFAVQQEQTDLGPPKFTVGITGVDIDASLTATLVKAVATGSVDVLVPFTKLVEIIGSVSAAECSIEAADETKATFRAGKYKAELKTHPLSNWPTIMERPEEQTATIALPGFKDQIDQVSFAVPASDGMHVVAVSKMVATPTVGDAPGQLTLVATDGFRLAISMQPINAGAFTLILPKPALDLIKKLDGTQLTISTGEAGFYFDTELETLTVCRSHGDFPNYETVLPKASTVQITVKKKELLEAIKRTKPLADPEKPVIVFSALANGVTLDLQAAHVEAGGDGSVFRNMASDEVVATITGSEFSVPLDSSLLLPFVETAFGSGDGDIVIQATTANKVVDFRANAGLYRFLQMPTQGAAAKA